MRSVREFEGDNTRVKRCHWNRTLPSLEQAGHAGRMKDREDSLSSLHLPEHTDLGDRGNGGEFLPGAAGASPVSCPGTLGMRLCRWN